MLKYGYETFNIISVDPGLSNLGLSIFTVKASIHNYSIQSIYSETLRPNSCYERYEHHDNNSTKYNELLNYLSWKINVNKPIAIVSEDSFYYESMPAAFKSVTTAICALRSAISMTNRNIMFQTLAPLNVKKHIGVSVKGKEAVKAAVLSLPDLQPVLPNNFEYLDEHAIDSIAVGYSYLKQLQEHQKPLCHYLSSTPSNS